MPVPSEPSDPFEYPRLTVQYLRSRIVDEQYYYFERTRTTVCSIHIDNGFSITTSVVCSNPENYDAAAGQKHAFNKALDKLRKCEYYVLKQRLHDEQLAQVGENDGSRI